LPVKYKIDIATNPVLLIPHEFNINFRSGFCRIDKIERHHLSYLTIKYLHISFVILSFTLFFLRGIWMLQSSPLLTRRWTKIFPHIIDTALLVSAIALAIQLSISPLAAPWLMTKIIALVVYIVLGTIAIKRGRTRKIRITAWVAAMLVFLYIVGVAMTHNPMPWQTL
jgi:uncharacterized membrane protein SirB2